MPFVGRTDVQDPGAQQDQWERLARRREHLYADDEQFRNTRPDEGVAAAARAPGLRIAEVMATVLQGYAIEAVKIPLPGSVAGFSGAIGAVLTRQDISTNLQCGP